MPRRTRERLHEIAVQFVDSILEDLPVEVDLNPYEWAVMREYMVEKVEEVMVDV